MYRILLGGVEWIIRFSPHVNAEDAEKDVIFQSLARIGRDLSSFSHGESFMVMDRMMGAIVFEVQRVPSFILTVCTIIPKEKWYMQ